MSNGPGQSAKVFVASVSQDGTFSVLARLTSLDGTGVCVNSFEGNCLVPGDVSSITCKVFSLASKDAATGTELTPDPTLTPAANLFSPLRTTGWDVLDDPAGYNFRHDVARTYVPTGGQWYRVEYLITLLAGGVGWLKVLVKAVNTMSE